MNEEKHVERELIAIYSSKRIVCLTTEYYI